MRDSQTIYHINPCLSMVSSSDSGEEFVVASIYGRIKIIKCAPSVLNEVLGLVDGRSAASSIVNVLQRKYPTEEVESFLATLEQTGVIVEKDTMSFTRHSLPSSCMPKVIRAAQELPPVSILLAGDGVICDLFEKSFSSRTDMTCRRIKDIDLGSIEEGGKECREMSRLISDEPLNKKNVVLVLCPDTCTQGRFAKMSKLCHDLQLPSIFCYFNGKDILVGPSVIPGKTPCYCCLLEHRRIFMGGKSGIDLELSPHFYPLDEARSLQTCPYDRAVLYWIASHVASEACCILFGGSPLSLAKKQLQVPLHASNRFSEVSFEAVTTCPCCSGMNHGRVKVGRPLTWHNENRPLIKLHHRPVAYSRGGRRSVTAQQARDMVESALSHAGLNLRVEKPTNGPLDGKLFRYCATVEAGTSGRLPFLFSERVTQRGKGITEEQAYLSAAFEAFERISADYHGDVEIVRASYEDVKDMALNLPAYLGTSFQPELMDGFEKTRLIDWVWGQSLAQKRPKLVPASVAFLSKGRFLGHFFNPSSGGLSAGSTMEDAILQGLLELIEHDAWIIWQANAVSTPRIRDESIDIPSLIPVIEHIQGRGMQIVIKNYTTDITIPVFRTWIVNPNDYRYYATNGFGANPDPAVALERSISEAYQPMEFVSNEEQRAYRGPSATQLAFSYYSLYSLYHFNKLEILGESAWMDYQQITSRSTDTVAGDIGLILSQLEQSIPGSDVIVVDLTKEIFGIPAVRVVVEGGLQRFAKPTISTHERLFELPLKMGYSQRRLTYGELFNGPFPH